MTPQLVPVFLDRMARLHATFWNDPRLSDPRLGMKDLLDSDVYAQTHQLIEQPQPLIEALNKYPSTLLHGDYRAENMAYRKPDQPIVFDWQNSTRSLMTIDLAWFVYQGYVRDVMGQAQAIDYYRGRLEEYLNTGFDDTEWQAMLDLGFLTDALGITCIAAYWYEHSDEPEGRRWNERAVKERNQQVRAGLRWITQ